MNFNLTNGLDDQNVQRPTMFNNIMYKPVEWCQVPPQHMPWARNPMPQSQIMAFGTQASFPNPPPLPIAKPQSSPICGLPPTNLIHCKRKSDLSSFKQVKQHITEERMAAHMSRLHISSESQAIDDEQIEETVSEPVEVAKPRERRLFVCEAMKRLQTESIIPAALQRRLERPCMAVMLWQPPERITQSLFGYRDVRENDEENAASAENLTGAVDSSNMDMDL